MKELERRFTIERAKPPAPGRTRRNLSRSAKEQVATTMVPTTLFDVFWRIRKKASYDDADAFVLGAAGELDARRLGEALVIVTDATVAALEAVMAAYVGPGIMAAIVSAYANRVSAGPASAVSRRAASWQGRVPAVSGF